MTTDEPIRLHGARGSPYSIKIRALLRYRRLPYIWNEVDLTDTRTYSRVRVPIIPILEFSDDVWMNDSTAIALELERRYPSRRSVLPTSEAARFLVMLLEDFADEWGAKLMFYFRWSPESGRELISRWLAFDRLGSCGRDTLEKEFHSFCTRQMLRMPLVGCIPENISVLESSADAIFRIFEKLATESTFLFGTRPSLADFAWLGQLSQIASDPVSSIKLRSERPYLTRWVIAHDDASGISGSWNSVETFDSSGVRDLVTLCGEIYLPYLQANREALQSGEKSFSIPLMNHQFRQAPFKFHDTCLKQLVKGYAGLSAEACSLVDDQLRQTRGKEILSATI